LSLFLFFGITTLILEKGHIHPLALWLWVAILGDFLKVVQLSKKNIGGNLSTELKRTQQILPSPLLTSKMQAFFTQKVSMDV
jgi:hypothetical protein